MSAATSTPEGAAKSARVWKLIARIASVIKRPLIMPAGAGEVVSSRRTIFNGSRHACTDKVGNDLPANMWQCSLQLIQR